MRDRRIAALQAEPNAPLNHFSPFIEDAAPLDISPDEMSSAIAATREATEQRLRFQSARIRRFHQQICLRVNERALQERESAQLRSKKADEKLARLLQQPTTMSNKSPTSSAMGRSLQLRRELVAMDIIEEKRRQIKGAPQLFTLVEKAVRADAQARDMLLASTSVPRTRICREDDDGVDDDDEEDAVSRFKETCGLDNKQVYAAVRRRYMALEREQAQLRAQTRRRSDNQNESPVDPASSSKRGNDEVKVVEAMAESDVPLKRQTSKASATPWRKSPIESAATPTSNSSSDRVTQRFMKALQEELATPSVCSCGRRSRSPCANNCEFYRQPKRKDRLVASVCKQNQT